MRRRYNSFLRRTELYAIEHFSFSSGEQRHYWVICGENSIVGSHSAIESGACCGGVGQLDLQHHAKWPRGHLA